MNRLGPVKAASLAVAGNALLLGLPLFFLGPPFSGPVVSCLGLALLFAASEAAFQQGQDSPTMRADPATILTGALTFLLLALALLLPDPAVSPGAWGGGAMMMLAGIALRAASMNSLGPRFVSEVRVLPRGARVETGLYRRARHPSEVGLLLLCAGAAVQTGSLPAAALMVFGLLPLAFLRTRRERVLLPA